MLIKRSRERKWNMWNESVNEKEEKRVFVANGTKV